jgi:hypothetical protein
MHRQASIDISRARNENIRRTIKPDVPPGEFKCRTCEVMWSSFMKSNIPCTDTSIRTGLHNFDFASPILYNK